MACSGKSKKVNVARMWAQGKVAWMRSEMMALRPPAGWETAPDRDACHRLWKRLRSLTCTVWTELSHVTPHWMGAGHRQHRVPRPGALSDLEGERPPGNGWPIKTIMSPTLMTVKVADWGYRVPSPRPRPGRG